MCFITLMAKLLILTNRFVIGGPSVHTAMLATGLQDDFDVQMVGGRAAHGEQTNLNLFKELKNEPILLPVLSPRFSLFSDLRYYFQIKKIIAEFQPDIIHTHTSKPGMWGRLAARRMGVKYIVHTYHGHLFHHYFTYLFSAVLVRVERYLGRKTDKVICLSDRQMKDIVENYKICTPEQTEVIHLGLKEEAFVESEKKFRTDFRTEYKLEENEIAIGVVGRVAKIKNLEFFIDAIQILKHKTNLKIRGFIIGDGPEKHNLKHYAIKHGVDYAEYSYGGRRADLIFTSWCKNVPYAMAGLDIVCLTSHNEGTPMSLLEAQLAGKPIVSVDVGGVRDVVINELGGKIVDQNALFGFVEALKVLLEDTDLRKKMGREGQSYIRENFSETKMIQQYKKLYKSLLSD